MSLEQTLERIAAALEKLAIVHAPAATVAAVNDAVKPAVAETGKAVNEVADAAAKKAAAADQGTDTLSYDILRANVIKLAACGSAGNAAAVKVLAEFKVKKASEAPATEWSAMNDRILEEYAAINAPPAAESFA